LGLEELLNRLLRAEREQIAWARIAAVLVIARLCEPSSELHIAEDWFRRTALADLLGIPEEKINDDLYICHPAGFGHTSNRRTRGKRAFASWQNLTVRNLEKPPR
jgi:hypothetical protein